MTRDLLVCAGSLTLDNVVTAQGQRLPQTCGGNVVYSALGARLWHARVGIVSRAGTDFPVDFIAMLHAQGLQTDGIRRLPVRHGMNVAFCYAADGSRVRAFPPEVIAAIPQPELQRFTDYGVGDIQTRFAIWTEFAPDDNDIPDAWLDSIGAVHNAAMPVQRHQAIAARIRATGKAWMQVDSPWYDERALERDEATPLFALVDAMLPSEDDVARADPARPIDITLAAMLRMGARRIVLKRGACGSRILEPGLAPVDIAALAGASIVDLTGAGDAYCGGFLAGMFLTGDTRQAALYGTVSASFAIQAAGVAGLLGADPSQVRQRLATVRAAAAF
ncbi:MAG: carbohydrate kinase family protein [Variovorax sp.]